MQIKKILQTAILLGLSFHFFSCNNKENIPPAKDIVPPKAYLLGLTQEIKLFTEREEEETTLLPSFIHDVNAGPTRELWISTIIQADALDYKLAHLLDDKTQELVNNKININDYLEFLLIERYNLLNSRSKAVEDYLLDPNDHAPYVAPTNKALAKWLDEHTEEAEKSYNKYMRSSVVRRYEWLNKLIQTTFKKWDIGNLAPTMTQLLRASVQLHPILEGTRTDLGHPDDACGYYAVLQHFFPTPQENLASELPELYQVYTGITEEGIDKRLFLKNFTLSIHQHIQQTGRTLSPLSREILKLKKEIDLDVFKIKLAPSKNFSTYGIPSEEVSWPYPLPNPAFLSRIRELKVTKVLSEEASETESKKEKKKRRRHNRRTGQKQILQPKNK